jgi:hypothetical protein
MQEAIQRVRKELSDLEMAALLHADLKRERVPQLLLIDDLVGLIQRARQTDFSRAHILRLLDRKDGKASRTLRSLEFCADPVRYPSVPHATYYAAHRSPQADDL